VYDVTMPKFSDSMEEGKIIRWRVKPGDEVRKGDVLAEIESDKAVMELESYRNGVVAEILHGDETEVAVGEVIARIGAKGEAAAERTGVPRPVLPGRVPPLATAGQDRPCHTESDVAQPPSAADVAQPPPRKRVRISPAARKLAQQRGIDYTTITGTGPGGRIVARDIEATGGRAGVPRPVSPGRVPPLATAGQDRPCHTESAVAQPPRAAADLPPLEVTDDEADVVPAPFRQKTQARRVTAATQHIPHFYLTCAPEVSRLIERQRELKERMGATLTHLVMLACLKTLKQHPEVNRSYDHGRIITWKGVNLGLAVDTDEGLTVAVLRQAQDLTLEDLVGRTGPLVERARAGRLSADERRHATFTVTNLGMFAVETFAPIINPPSSITLAVASARPASVVRDGAIRIGRLMHLTAACDHRIVDGVTAARFMQDLAALIEDPERLMG